MFTIPEGWMYVNFKRGRHSLLHSVSDFVCTNQPYRVVVFIPWSVDRLLAAVWLCVWYNGGLSFSQATNYVHKRPAVCVLARPENDPSPN
jgi:hypothetical protein